MSRSRLLVALVVAFTLAAAAQAASGATADLLEEGRAVYNFRCYFCHGYSGNAKTLAATFLTPPPADFTRAAAKQLTREAISATLRNGRPGTAMKSFSSIISEREMAAVANFVVDEFVVRRAPNTHYHTAENGWPDHQRYRSAFPFATGEIPLSRSWESLDKSQAAGKRLYLASCISCHDRGAAVGQEDLIWDARPLPTPESTP